MTKRRTKIKSNFDGNIGSPDSKWEKKNYKRCNFSFLFFFHFRLLWVRGSSINLLQQWRWWRTKRRRSKRRDQLNGRCRTLRRHIPTASSVKFVNLLLKLMKKRKADKEPNLVLIHKRFETTKNSF